MTTQEPGLGAPATSACGTDCDEALGRLFEYLDSELDAPDAERVRAHLEE